MADPSDCTLHGYYEERHNPQGQDGLTKRDYVFYTDPSMGLVL
jgi:hypothetical protein